MTFYKKIFENNVGKGENAGNQDFLLFPHPFSPFCMQITMLGLDFLSSANAFNFELCKILSGEEIKAAIFFGVINPFPNKPLFLHI